MVEKEGRDNGRRRRTEETRADLEQTANDAPPPLAGQKSPENSGKFAEQQSTVQDASLVLLVLVVQEAHGPVQ